jgi:hypothetical protein
MLSEDDTERARIYRHTINTLEARLSKGRRTPDSLGGLRLGAIFGDFSRAPAHRQAQVRPGGPTSLTTSRSSAAR